MSEERRIWLPPDEVCVRIGISVCIYLLGSPLATTEVATTLPGVTQVKITS